MASSFPPSNGNNNNGESQQQPQPQMPSSQQNLALFMQQSQQSGGGGGETNTPPTISQHGLAALAAAEQQLQQQQDLRALALQQQLAALMQQSSQQSQQSGAQSTGSTILPQSGISAFLPLGGNQQSTGPIQSVAVGPQIGGGAAGGGSALLGFYQQLLALQQAQQQQQQQQQQQNSTPTVAALPQQFSTALHLQNSPATSVLSQPPLSGAIGGGAGTPGTATPQQGSGQGIQQAQHSGAGDSKLSGLLSGLLASNPALLHSILGQQQQQQQQNPLLAALSAHLLLPQQQQAQQQPQQQAQLASLLQLLNPNAATMYAYQSYLQQQQQQVQQQPTTNTSQLQLLVQLLANNGGAGGGGSGLQSILAALNGNQQQTLLAALAAQQQQHVQAQPTPPQPPPPPPQDEGRLLLEQLIRQNREQQQKLQQQQQLGVSRSFPGAAIDPAHPSPSSSSTNAATAAAILAASLQQQQQQGGNQQQAQQHFVQQQQEQNQQETVTDLVMQQLQQQAAQQAVQQAQYSSQQVATTPQQNSQQLPGQIHVQPIGFVGGEGGDEMQQMSSNSGPLSAGSSSAAAQQQQQQSANRGTPTASERLLTSEAVQDRISRLISENEAIVEPNPVLLKRRPYQRQGTSNSMTSQTSENAGTSQRGSPGIRSPGIGGGNSSSVGFTPKMHPATTRSFSLHEASFLRLGGGSLTSGQPIINRQQLQQQLQQQLTCNFCQLKFPNEAGLEAHELRCSKKEMLLQKQQSQPQLKFAAAAASLVQQQQQQQFQLQQQLQQLQEHQSTIAALVGGGKGVARDLVINGNGGNVAAGNGGGRASVPSLESSSSNPSSAAAIRILPQQQQQIRSQLGQSNSDSRLKKRGLEDSSDGGAGNGQGIGGQNSNAAGANSIEMAEIADTSIDSMIPQQPGAESSKMARIELATTTTMATQPAAGPSTSAVVDATQSTKQIGESSVSAQQQSQPQPVLTMRDAIIFAITYSTDLRSTVKMPYFLTLTPAELDALAAGQGGDPTAGVGHFRGRTRNITSETFVCLNKVRPTPSEHRDNCSAYSAGWSQPTECANGEAQLVQLFWNVCNTSTRTRLDPFSGEYTLAASRESVQLRTTHSSFWSQQQQKANRSGSCPLSPRQINGCDEPMDTTNFGAVEQQTAQNDGGQRNSFAINNWMESDNDEIAMQNVIKMEVDDKENATTTGPAAAQQLKKEPKEEKTAQQRAAYNKKATKGKFELLNKLALPNSRRNDEMMEMQISTTQAMVQVYIRGRGRGRYVCERCGIRCKKPSMLKKHLRSHTNVRPFTCLTCNFSFKTKGNLTKHLVSKAHKRRMEDIGGDEGIREEGHKWEEEDEEGEGRLIVAEEEEEEAATGSHHGQHQKMLRKQNELERQRLSRLGALEQKFMEGVFDRDEDDEDWDEEDEDADNSPEQEVPPPPPGTLSYRRFGQENILVERETHTPPTFWTLMCPEAAGPSGHREGGVDPDDHGEVEPSEWGWPQPEDADRERGCHSAPPAALCSPEHSRTRRRKKAAEMKQELNELIQQQQQDTKQELEPPQPALANFIPQIRQQQLPSESSIPPPQQQPMQKFQQPSLAAQLAAGLLQAVPFHQPPQQHQQQVAPPIGIAGQTAQQVQQQAAVAQQLLFQLNEQQQQQSSAFAPPQSQQQQQGQPGSLPLSSALKMLEGHIHQQNVAGQQIGTIEGGNRANGLMAPAAGNESFTRSTLEAFLATEVQQFQCDMCERKFRKESELLLHKQTHLIEKGTRQKAAFQCGECPTVVRSKSMLARHSESVHGRSLGEEQQLMPGMSGGNAAAGYRMNSVAGTIQQNSGSTNPPSSSISAQQTSNQQSQSTGNGQIATGSAQQQNSSSISASQMLPPPAGAVHNNHFRNFLCTDCGLGFRSHGVLAKHLRSKNHLKMLVSLGKLSEDANALLSKENNKALNSIDASDCEKSLQSIKQLVGKMREQLGMEMEGTMLTNGGDEQPSMSNSTIDHQQNRPPSSEGGGFQQFSPPPPPNGFQHGNQQQKCAASHISGPPRIMGSLGSGMHHKRPMEPLPHGLKRTRTNEIGEATTMGSAHGANEENSTAIHFHSPSPQHHQRRDSFSSPSPQRPKLSRESLINQQAESPLHSLAQVAVAAAAAAAAAASQQSAASPAARLSPLPSHQNHQQQKTFVANVWVPPKFEQLIQEQMADRKSCTPELLLHSHQQNGGTTALIGGQDRLNSLLSNRSAEETSESTGTRSESSTPVQRPNNQHSGPGFSPMSGATRCQLCELNFDTPTDLAVHFHADHVIMRHGRDFRCSRRNCEKVFPSRDSLRAHIHAHFFGAILGSDASKEGDHFQSNAFAASCPSSPSMVGRRPPAPSAPPPCAQSPGIPEESHSSALSHLHSQNQQNGNHHQTMVPQSFSSPPSVASNFGGACTPTKATNRWPKAKQHQNVEGGEGVGKGSGGNEQQLVNQSAATAGLMSLLCCQFCAEQLPDVQSLQAHWVKQHMAQLTRPHVGVECDAGFTTDEALRAHRERQHGLGGNNGTNQQQQTTLAELKAERR